MPRPQRCRRVCREPVFTEFTPEGASFTDTVTLTTDEFEAIRLIDLEQNTQEQCAEIMDVSRTTVTGIYDSARRKIAEGIVRGKRIAISGGNYRLCDGSAVCRNCPRRTEEKQLIFKGDNTMKIAVTYENGQIFQHFGHTEQFKVYTVEDGKIVDAKVIGTNGSGHGALAGMLFANQIDVLICGGIGGGAQVALAEAGIRLYGGVSGDADAAVQALIEGKLEYDPNVMCSHHGHGDHDHSCGDHGCGSHDCGSHGCH
ncbi:MAG: DUF134 domain-containing protein [Christensenellaceae bacterium]|nr:DUF134 domain-containing protein [Christensenellaceae bacterium]